MRHIQVALATNPAETRFVTLAIAETITNEQLFEELSARCAGNEPSILLFGAEPLSLLGFSTSKITVDETAEATSPGTRFLGTSPGLPVLPEPIAQPVPTSPLPQYRILTAVMTGKYVAHRSFSVWPPGSYRSGFKSI